MRIPLLLFSCCVLLGICGAAVVKMTVYRLICVVQVSNIVTNIKKSCDKCIQCNIMDLISANLTLLKKIANTKKDMLPFHLSQ